MGVAASFHIREGMTMRTELIMRLDRVVELAAKLLVIEEEIKNTVDMLEDMTGLPLREAVARLKNNEIQGDEA
jgi:hypothetical protein